MGSTAPILAALSLIIADPAAAACRSGIASVPDGTSDCRGGKAVICATGQWQSRDEAACFNRPSLVIFGETHKQGDGTSAKLKLVSAQCDGWAKCRVSPDELRTLGISADAVVELQYLCRKGTWDNVPQSLVRSAAESLELDCSAAK